MKFNALAGLVVSASVAAMVGPGAPPKRVGVKLAPPQPPRRLSTDPTSPAYDAPSIRRILVKFDGIYRDNDCHAYDADEGWIDIRRRNGKGRFLRNSRDEFITERKFGIVEPVWKAVPQVKAAPPAPAAPPLDLSVAATEKRARKAAKRAREAAKEDARAEQRKALSKFQGGYVIRAGSIETDAVPPEDLGRPVPPHGSGP